MKPQAGNKTIVQGPPGLSSSRSLNCNQIDVEVAAAATEKGFLSFFQQHADPPKKREKRRSKTSLLASKFLVRIILSHPRVIQKLSDAQIGHELDREKKEKQLCTHSGTNRCQVLKIDLTSPIFGYFWNPGNCS